MTSSSISNPVMFGTVGFIAKRCIQKYRILGLYRVVFGLSPFSKPEVSHFSPETVINFTSNWEEYIYIRIGRGTSKNVNSSKTGNDVIIIFNLVESRHVWYRWIRLEESFTKSYRKMKFPLFVPFLLTGSDTFITYNCLT